MKHTHALLALALFTFLFISSVSARELSCVLDQPLYLWKFNEGIGTQANDSCNATVSNLINGVTWEDGKYGNATRFDGTSGYIDAGTALQQGLTNFSFSLWTNYSSALNYGTYETFFQRGNYYTDEYVEAIGWYDYGQDFILFMNADNVGHPSITDGEWHNVIGTFEGDTGNVSLYVDGVIQFSTITAQTQISSTTNSLLIGANYANYFMLNGALDDVAFFDRIISPNEAKNIFQPLHSEPDLDIVFFTEQYPYVDVNTWYPLKVKLFKNNSEITNAKIALSMNILENNGSATPVNFFFNETSQYYETELLFNETGDYKFFIEANSFTDGYTNTTGTFLVRNPFYVTFNYFNNKTGSLYINNFAFTTAQYTNGTLIYLDPYIAPLNFPLPKGSPVFHAPMTNGQSVVKLFDRGNYTFRLIDGNIIFPYTYSSPIILKSYGVNINLGALYVNQNSTFDIYITDNDLHPYKWIINVGLIIALILIAIIAGILFFMFPAMPFISIGFGFVFAGMAVLIRFILWWFVGM